MPNFVSLLLKLENQYYHDKEESDDEDYYISDSDEDEDFEYYEYNSAGEEETEIDGK